MDWYGLQMTAMEKHHLITHVGTHGEWSQIHPVIHVSSPTSTMVNIGIYWGCLHPPQKKKTLLFKSQSMVISHDISRPISYLRTHFGSFYPHGGACPARSTGSTGRSNFTVPHKKSSAATQLDICWGDVHESNWSVTVAAAWNPGFFRWYRGYG
jgi:hypothetical protein